ncbi:MAG: NADPH-dependent glutamate synthase [Oscillospiraceae bacterium]|nr:NADPH-dependent glutamate synthase [Oscillospiraceae bacterium]
MINLTRERNEMPQQDSAVRCSNFGEVALGFTQADAIREAMRCLNCRKKPCTTGCPVGMHIPAFIAKVAEGDFEGAYEEISIVSCLPAVCGRVCAQEIQCEQQCVHAENGEAVGIGRLERFVADYHAAHCAATTEIAAKPSGKRVAVIGSGPAGIACAGDLAKLGYAVTIFERMQVAGGILCYGIPEFCLPNEVVDREISALRAEGVELVTGAGVDAGRTVDSLFADGFAAVFVGNGAEVPMEMHIPGEELSGVYNANDYLTQINLNRDELPSAYRQCKRAVIVGCGNVAIDAARCARRMGAEVTIVYRRTLAESPARLEEIHHAQEEDIAFRLLTNPVAFIGENGKLTGVKCVQMALGEPDESGRRRPVEISGSEFVIPADTVVLSIGTSFSDDITANTEGVSTGKRGGIDVDDCGATSRPGVFAGGDAVTGPATVVAAMGAGKRAAAGIHQYLSKK